MHFCVLFDLSCCKVMAQKSILQIFLEENARSMLIFLCLCVFLARRLWNNEKKRLLAVICQQDVSFGRLLANRHQYRCFRHQFHRGV